MQSPMPHRQTVDWIKKRQLSASLGASVSNVKPLEESVESGMMWHMIMIIMHYDELIVVARLDS